MGNCCSSPDKEDQTIISNEAPNGQGEDIVKTISLPDKQSERQDSSKIETDHHRASGQGVPGTNVQSGPPMTSSLTSITPKTAAGGQSTMNLPNQLSATKIPSSQFLQQNRSATNINFNQNNNNNNNNTPSENDSLNGYPPKQPPQSNKGMHLNNVDSLRLGDELNSQRMDTQELELNGLIEQHVVCTNEQLQNTSTTKLAFLCRNDSKKSFILSMPHAQTSQPGSMQQLLETASKIVCLANGTPAVSMQLLFGMPNASASVLSQADCFPAYFKTKQIFEESFSITIQLQQGSTGGAATTSNKRIMQVVFPSMTVEDVKNELHRADPSVCPSLTSVFRFGGHDEMLNSGYRSASVELLVNGTKHMMIPLQDHEKFCLSAVNHSIEDCCLVVRNAEEDTSADAFWPDAVNNNAVVPSETTEIQVANKQESGDALNSPRAVKIGLNLELECKNSDCKSKGKRFVKPLGVGVFELVAGDAKALQCTQCGKSNQIILHSIGFFACRFAYTGVQELMKKSAAKWDIAHHRSTITRLEINGFNKKSSAGIAAAAAAAAKKSSSNSESISWTSVWTESNWSKFKVYTKRVSYAQRFDKDEELMHMLSIEAMKSDKMCGVCKAQVNEQMQHTLDCGHAFHKICLNMLPSIFKSIKCPLCVSNNLFNILSVV